MTKKVRPEFAYHADRLSRSRNDRRELLRQGWEAFGYQGPAADPPYGGDDPRRWWWQTGWEKAFDRHQGKFPDRIEAMAEWTA